MSKKDVIVHVDWREERGNSVIDAARDHDEVADVKLVELDVGDLAVHEADGDGVVVFERKSVSDFANSMTDEDDHLREQVERLKAATDAAPRVLIEGNMEDFETLRHTNVLPRSLRGFAASLEERNGATVTFCSDLDTLVDYAVRGARKQFEEDSASSLRVESATKKSAPFTVRFFGLVDGVGAETAHSLHQHFPTVESAVQASEEDFLEVDGVGPKTASRIYTSLRQNV